MPCGLTDLCFSCTANLVTERGTREPLGASATVAIACQTASLYRIDLRATGTGLARPLRARDKREQDGQRLTVHAAAIEPIVFEL